MTLADTDTLTLEYYGKPGVTERVMSARDAGELHIPIVARLEILRGRIEAVRKAADGAAVLRMQQRLIDAEAFLATYPVRPLDATAVRHFDRLRALKRYKNFDRGDLLIACTALAHNAIVVTPNVKDFAQVPGLKVENWAD